eukprot:4150291-Prymnesium_polylepis.2
MDIATNGENAALKYEDNAEVMNYLRKLEELMTKGWVSTRAGSHHPHEPQPRRCRCATGSSRTGDGRLPGTRERMIWRGFCHLGVSFARGVWWGVCGNMPVRFGLSFLRTSNKNEQQTLRRGPQSTMSHLLAWVEKTRCTWTKNTIRHS